MDLAGAAEPQALPDDEMNMCVSCQQTKPDKLFACKACASFTCANCPWEALAGSDTRKRYGGNGQSLETTRQQGWCMFCRPDMTCCGFRLRAPRENGASVGRKWRLDRNGHVGEKVSCGMNIGILQRIDPEDTIGRAFIKCPHCRNPFCYFKNPDKFQKLLEEARDDVPCNWTVRYSNFRGCVTNPTAFLGGSTGKKSTRTGKMQLYGNGCGQCPGSRKEIQYLTNKESRFQEIDKAELEMSAPSSENPSSDSDDEEYNPVNEATRKELNKFYRWHHREQPKREDNAYDPTKDRTRFAKTAHGDYKLLGSRKVKLTVWKENVATKSNTERRKRAATGARETSAKQFKPNGKAAATSYDDPYQQGDGKSVGLYGGFGNQVLVQEKRFNPEAESLLSKVEAQEQKDTRHEEELRAEILERGEEVPSDDPLSSEEDM